MAEQKLHLAKREDAHLDRGLGGVMAELGKSAGAFPWGGASRVYPTKEQAEKQAKAAYAAGYKDKGSK